MALEEKKVSLTETVSCAGSKEVLGIRIHCHKVTGHGALSFAQGLQQSCNVWFMTLGGRIGIEDYCDYVEAFGYREKTGVGFTITIRRLYRSTSKRRRIHCNISIVSVSILLCCCLR